MPGRPFSELSKDIPTAIGIADDIASYALNPPFLSDLWFGRGLISPSTLNAMMRRELNNPSMRFRMICARLEGIHFSEIDAWSKAMSSGEPEFKERCRRLPISSAGDSDLVPAVFRFDLPKSDTLRVVISIGKKIGLFASTPIILSGYVPYTAQPNEEAIQIAWSIFKLLHSFDKSVDRLQVCVLQSAERRIYRELRYEENPVKARRARVNAQSPSYGQCATR